MGKVYLPESKLNTASYPFWKWKVVTFNKTPSYRWEGIQITFGHCFLFFFLSVYLLLREKGRIEVGTWGGWAVVGGVEKRQRELCAWKPNAYYDTSAAIVAPNVTQGINKVLNCIQSINTFWAFILCQNWFYKAQRSFFFLTT